MAGEESRRLADLAVPRCAGKLGFATGKQITAGPALLGLALTLGLVLRLAPMLLTDFPLGDGGLFATMANDIRNSHFALPLFSSFNAGDVPFAYPPIGLYILAAIPGDPISTERWLPLAWSLMAIAFAYLLARELTGERSAGIAALVFAAMPATWAIEGGGVTRALALALMLAALWRVARTLHVPTIENAGLAGVLAGLAMLAHPGVGPTGLTSAVVLLLFLRSRRGAIALSEASAVAIAVMAPWLAVVVQRYGIGALKAASMTHHTEEALGRLLTVGPSWGGALDFVLPLTVLGTIVAVHRRQWLLPLWLAIVILVPGGEGRYATFVWAMLAAVGTQTVATALREIGADRLAARVALAALFMASLLAGYQRFDALPSGIRKAMLEAGSTSPPGTRFAVVIDDPGLAQPVLDWFPTLSGRISVGTFMGLEWTSVAKWDETVGLNRAIQRGIIPPDVDALFVVQDHSARVDLVH